MAGLDSTTTIVSPSYIWNASEGRIYLAEVDGTDVTIGEFYTDSYEVTTIPIVLENGIIVQRQGIKFPHKGSCRTLYLQAYDVAKKSEN